MTTPCPVAGCDHTMRPAEVMCGHCWKRVRPATRREVTEQWAVFARSFAPADQQRYERVLRLARVEAARHLDNSQPTLPT